VWADSDVDIVLKHSGTFYCYISAMSEKEQQAFKAIFSTNAEYGELDKAALQWGADG
jgi:hypothetical protein